LHYGVINSFGFGFVHHLSVVQARVDFYWSIKDNTVNYVVFGSDLVQEHAKLKCKIVMWWDQIFNHCDNLIGAAMWCQSVFLVFFMALLSNINRAHDMMQSLCPSRLKISGIALLFAPQVWNTKSAHDWNFFLKWV
jgi:hypothetical protein